MVGVVQVIALVRRVKVVHVDVKVVGGLSQLVLALVQGEADGGGGQLLPLGRPSSSSSPLQGERGWRGYGERYIL